MEPAPTGGNLWWASAGHGLYLSGPLRVFVVAFVAFWLPSWPTVGQCCCLVEVSVYKELAFYFTIETDFL